MSKYSLKNPLPIAVLISGNGSNLQAIIDAIAQGLPVKIQVVISNQPTAYGLERARNAQIPTEILSHTAFTSRDAYDTALQALIKRYQPKLIILAGFMRILSKNFVNSFKNQILNIHPSLLPKYPGLHTHEQVLAAKDQQHGATVHLVTEDLDAGPILGQAKLSVNSNDTLSSLQERIHVLEHKLYVKILSLYAQGRLQFGENYITLDDKPLSSAGFDVTDQLRS